MSDLLKENAELTRKVTSGLSQVVQSCAKANQSCEYGFLDEGFVYDLKVTALNDVAIRTIERFCNKISNSVILGSIPSFYPMEE